MTFLARYALGVATLAICGGALGAQDTAPRTRVEIKGRVTDSAGAALGGVEIRLRVAGEVRRLTRSGDDGTFAFAHDTTEAGRLELRRLGYRARDVSLVFPRDAGRIIAIRLDAAPTQLSGVTVAESPVELAGWMREFYDRRRTNSFGRFYTADSIRAGGARNPSDVLRMVPGVRLLSARRGGYIVRMRACRMPPIIWIDGARLPQAELDESINVEDVAGMEVYSSYAGVPAQFMDRSNGGCGTIVIWTRHR